MLGGDLDFDDEATFQRVVVEVARLHGWAVAHFPPSLSARGRHMTAYAYDAKGWPDLTLVHPERGVMFREIKTNKGRIAEHQAEWLRRLHAAGNDAGIWRPSDWQRILLELGAKGGRTNAPTDHAPRVVPLHTRLRRSIGETSDDT